ncbi:MAG: hypothetical protein A2Y41_04725 [Spirochaetes bacterium GWB1_36_13]|nr:MAG: hypothetical protein A2Y41_04725 [Spirochaetes bacterium GWB1_36_13]
MKTEEKQLLEEIKVLNQQISDNRKTGFKGIVFNYPTKKLKKSKILYLSLFLSLIFAILSFFYCTNLYDIFIDFNNLIISIFPNLLGFTLGGYALIIGFGNKELLKKFTIKSSKSPNSLFQKINSVFAYAIIIQVITLGSSIIIFLINKIKIKSDFHQYVNSFGLFLVSFFTTYSLLLLYKMVINVFDFGQLHHFDLITRRLHEKREILKEIKNNKSFD